MRHRKGSRHASAVENSSPARYPPSEVEQAELTWCGVRVGIRGRGRGRGRVRGGGRSRGRGRGSGRGRSRG